MLFLIIFLAKSLTHYSLDYRARALVRNRPSFIAQKDDRRHQIAARVHAAAKRPSSILFSPTLILALANAYFSPNVAVSKYPLAALLRLNAISPKTSYFQNYSSSSLIFSFHGFFMFPLGCAL